MQTPVLTKKQQKQSLSAKKTRSKETIKNVLASPFAKYWPQISSEDCDTLNNVLEQSLTRIVQQKPKIPWSELRTIPKAQRKEFKNARIEKDEIVEHCREGLIVGVNDVTKALEKGLALSVLISGDVRPKVMVEHLIDQTVLQRVPILVVPDLRNILLTKCGVGSVAVAFSKSERYKSILTCIESIYKNYPVPPNHINYQRSLNYVIVETDCKSNEAGDKKDESRDHHFTDSPNIYLFRDSTDQRVFVPAGVSNLAKKTIGMESLEYMALESQGSKETTVSNHIPLKVKRIKGDVNRNKRKSDLIKQRSKKRKV